MAKISTPKTSVKIVVAAEEQYVSSETSSKDMNPSEHIINNILNYSKSLDVKRTGNGTVITNVMN